MYTPEKIVLGMAPLFGALACALAVGCSGPPVAPTTTQAPSAPSDAGSGLTRRPDARPAAARDAGSASPVLEAEAGFFDLPATPAGAPGPTGRGRMFYSFHPADHGSEAAPLVVFFNGGPGEATSAILLPFGTGPYTLDSNPETPPDPTPNSASWTRFANILYLDSRLAGFSYAMGRAGCSGSQLRDAERYYLIDAGDFVLGLLDFLDTHPGIAKNTVVIAGESYGGTRAMLIELLLLHYDVPLHVDSSPTLPDPKEVLPWLHERVQVHVDRVMPEKKGRAASPAEMASQFGHAVLLEPGFGGEFVFSMTYMQRDPDLARYFAHPNEIDPYDVRQTLAESQMTSAHAARAMREPWMLGKILGVDPVGIAGLAADEREGATRGLSPSEFLKTAARESAMSAKLGELSQGDSYWIADDNACTFMCDVTSGVIAIELFPELDLFMTRARYDAVIDTEALVAFWQSVGLEATIDEHAPRGAARPGMLTLKFGKKEATFRFPKYDAGHEITLSRPAELAADVFAWMRDTELLP
jgi:hypothetical protein